MDPAATTSITESAIVIAGFSGLVLVLGQGGGQSETVAEFRIITMLLFAFSAAFGSLIPTIVQSFTLDIEVWEISCFWLAMILAANVAATFLLMRRLTHKERSELKRWMIALVFVGNPTFIIWIFLNLIGFVPGTPTAPFISALVWQLVLSSLLFVRLILNRPKKSPIIE